MTLAMYPHQQPGRLITFCGLDGCGKTTLIHLLQQHFITQGQSVFLTRQPTEHVRGSAIFRNFMDYPNHDAFDYRALSLLAASDRIQHSNRIILPQLVKGNTVISDRYFYSCLANLRARGYRQDKWIYEIVQSIPKPDFAFFLDIDVDLAVSRVRSRAAERDRYIDMDLQHALCEEYRAIAAANDGILLSSAQDAQVTFAQILKHIEGVPHASH